MGPVFNNELLCRSNCVLLMFELSWPIVEGLYSGKRKIIST